MNQTVWTSSNLNFNLTTGQVRDHWSYDSSCFMVTFVVIVHSKPQTRTSWWHQRKRQRISQVIVIHPPGTMNIYIKFHSKPSNISFWMWKPNRTTDTCGVWLTSDVSAIPSADSKADERDEIRSLKDGGKKLCMSLTLLWDPLSLSSLFVWMIVWFPLTLAYFETRTIIQRQVLVKETTSLQKTGVAPRSITKQTEWQSRVNDAAE